MSQLKCSICGAPATKWDGGEYVSWSYTGGVAKKLGQQFRCDEHDPGNRWFILTDKERLTVGANLDSVEPCTKNGAP